MTIEIVDLPIDSMVIFQFVMGQFTRPGNQIMSIVCDMFQREMDKLLACEWVCKNLLEPVQNIGLQLGRLECVFFFIFFGHDMFDFHLFLFIYNIYIYILALFFPLLHPQCLDLSQPIAGCACGDRQATRRDLTGCQQRVRPVS